MLILCFVELKPIVHQHSLGSTSVLWQRSLPLCCSQQLQVLPPVAAEHNTLNTAAATAYQGALHMVVLKTAPVMWPHQANAPVCDTSASHPQR